MRIAKRMPMEKLSFPSEKAAFIVLCIPLNMDVNNQYLKKLKKKTMEYLQADGKTSPRPQRKQHTLNQKTGPVEGGMLLFCLDEKEETHDATDKRLKEAAKYFDVPLSSIILLQQLVETIKLKAPSSNADCHTPTKFCSPSFIGNVVSSVASVISVASCAALWFQNSQFKLQMNKGDVKMNKMEFKHNSQMMQSQAFQRKIKENEQEMVQQVKSFQQSSVQYSKSKEGDVQNLQSLCNQLNQKWRSIEQKLTEQSDQSLSLETQFSQQMQQIRSEQKQKAALVKQLSKQLHTTEEHLKSRSAKGLASQSQLLNQIKKKSELMNKEVQSLETQLKQQMTKQIQSLEKDVQMQVKNNKLLEKKSKSQNQTLEKQMKSIQGQQTHSAKSLVTQAQTFRRVLEKSEELSKEVRSLEKKLNHQIQQSRSFEKQSLSVKQTTDKQLQSMEQLMKENNNSQTEKIGKQQKELDDIRKKLTHLTLRIEDLAMQDGQSHTLGKQLCKRASPSFEGHTHLVKDQQNQKVTHRMQERLPQMGMGLSSQMEHNLNEQVQTMEQKMNDQAKSLDYKLDQHVKQIKLLQNQLKKEADDNLVEQPLVQPFQNLLGQIQRREKPVGHLDSYHATRQPAVDLPAVDFRQKSIQAKL